MALKSKSDPRWRMRYAKNFVGIERMVEEVFGQQKKLESEIIAVGIEYLEKWPDEKSYLAHIEASLPEIDKLWAKLKTDAVKGEANDLGT